jgi:hypothetical protein
MTLPQINESLSGRRHCSYCKSQIMKGEHFIDFSVKFYRDAKAQNLCIVCLQSLATLTKREAKKVAETRMVRQL